MTIIIIPFNDLPYLSQYFGALANEGTFYILIIIMPLWVMVLLEKNKLRIPGNSSFKLLSLFWIWTIISFIFNIPDIISAEFKGRSGMEKYLFQMLILSLEISASLLIYFIFRNKPRFLSNVRYAIIISALIAGMYSIFEISALMGAEGIRIAVLDPVDSFIHGADIILSGGYYGRLRSVTAEASWFGVYSSLVFPWLLSFLTQKSKYSIFYILFVSYYTFMIVLTQSRTAYFVTIAEIVVFFLISGTWKNFLLRYKMRLGVFILVGLIAVLLNSIYFQGKSTIFEILASINDSDNMSNIARFGSQIAAINMAADHPVFGVGLGQYGFYMQEYVPRWAWISPEIIIYTSNSPGTSWPPVHNIFARLVAELGFIGLIIWVCFWGSLIKNCYRKYKAKKKLYKKDSTEVALITSMFGVWLSGFNGDSFSFFGYWLLLGVGWVYLKNNSFYN